MEEQDSGWGRKSGAVDPPLLEISGGLFGFRDKKAFKAHLEWNTLDVTGDCRGAAVTKVGQAVDSS